MMRVARPLAALATAVIVAAGCASDESAQDIFGQAQKRLGTARTLQLREESVTTVAYDGKPTGRAWTKRVEVLFKRPDKVVRRDNEGGTWVDGKTVVQYVTASNRYSTDQLDAHLRGIVFDGIKWEWGRRVSNLGVAIGINYVRRARSLDRLSDGTVNGKRVYVLRLRMKGENDAELTQTLWIGQSDHVVYKSEAVTVGPQPLSRHALLMGRKPMTMKITVVTRLLGCKVNGPISDAAFRFVPPAGARPFVRPTMHPVRIRRHQ